MSRIRSVHPGLFTDEAFVTVSDAAQIFYIGLLTEADDQGIFEWKPITLKMRLRPATTQPVDGLLEELRGAEKIARYEIGGRYYGAIRNFRKFQRPKSPNATHPITDEWRNYVGLSSSISEIDEVDAPPLPPKGEIAPQMEEVGDKKKEPPNPPAIVEPPRSSPNDHAANGVIPASNLPAETEIEKDVRAFNFAFFKLREIEFGGPPVPSSYPAKDLSVARGWIERGVEFYPFRELLEQQMRRMAKANKPPPSNLWFFNRSVDEAIASDWQGYRE